LRPLELLFGIAIIGLIVLVPIGFISGVILFFRDRDFFHREISDVVWAFFVAAFIFEIFLLLDYWGVRF
jgi:hypothetical protein